VFDSVEEDEYVETINKLGANVKCIEEAESEQRQVLVCTGADIPEYYAALDAQP